MTAAKALYAPLLGHRRDFARKMAAQSLAPAVRRLKPKAMRRHARQLVGALAAGSVTAGAHEARAGARLRADTLDGCSQLLFFVSKGVHGRMHSQVGGARTRTATGARECGGGRERLIDCLLCLVVICCMGTLVEDLLSFDCFSARLFCARLRQHCGA